MLPKRKWNMDLPGRGGWAGREQLGESHPSRGCRARAGREVTKRL